MKTNAIVRLLGALPIFSLILAGCGGGSSAPPLAGAPRTPLANVTFVITWPDPRSALSLRRPRYLSNGTKSVTISVNGGAPTVVDNPNLMPGASPGTKTTSVGIGAPLGTDQFTVGDYDMTGGQGNLLARTTFTFTVVEGQVNTIGATLDGNLNNIAVSPVLDFNSDPFITHPNATTYTMTGGFSHTFNLVPRDATNNIIIAPGAIPGLSLTSSDPKSVSVAPTGQPNQFKLTPLKADATVTMIAAGSDLDNNPVTTTFTVKTLAMIYVVNSGACTTQLGGTSTVSAFSETGVPIPLPMGAFSGLFDCTQGIMYAPESSGAVAPLYVTYNKAAPQQGQTPCPPELNPAPPPVAFDFLGTKVALDPCAFIFWDDPAFSRFAPTVGTNGEFLMVGNLGGQVFHEYDPKGNLLDRAGDDSGGASDFFALLNTGSVAVDTNDDAQKGNYYFANNCQSPPPPTNRPCAVQWFTPDGTLKGVVDVGTGGPANSIVFDPHNSQLYATSGSLPGGVFTLTETLAMGISAPFAGLASSADIAFNPGTNLLYVTDPTANTVRVYTENGVPASSVNPTTAFPGLANPQGLVIVP